MPETAESERTSDQPETIRVIQKGFWPEQCRTYGHHHTSAGYTFARDANGTAFLGDRWKQAKKYGRWVCQRCLQVVEVEVCPRLEIKTPKPPAPKSPNRGTSK